MLRKSSSHSDEEITPHITRHAKIPDFVNKPASPSTAMLMERSPRPSNSDAMLNSRSVSASLKRPANILPMPAEVSTTYPNRRNRNRKSTHRCWPDAGRNTLHARIAAHTKRIPLITHNDLVDSFWDGGIVMMKLCRLQCECKSSNELKLLLLTQGKRNVCGIHKQHRDVHRWHLWQIGVGDHRVVE
jgi:hypothetical protein